MKTVYRIENDFGYGMYYAGANAAEEMFEWGRDSAMRHPPPKKDSAFGKSLRAKYGTFCFEKEISKYKFGFCSKEQLLSWIYKEEWLVSLHNEGFTLSIISCEDGDVIEGSTQCAFNNPVSSVRYSLKSYFKLDEE